MNKDLNNNNLKKSSDKNDLKEQLNSIKSFMRKYLSGINIWIIVIVVITLWAAQGLHTIDEPEVGLVKRFGKHVRTVGPGLHYHIPAPVETVIPVDVKSVRKIEVGYETISPPPDPKYRSNKEEALMLTADNNIVHIEFAVQYKIQNAENYAFNVIDARTLLKEMAEAVMREEIAKTNFEDIITTSRGEIAQSVHTSLQKLVNSYDTGMMVENVKLQDANPPQPVTAAFDDVNSAKENKENYINQANAYANEVIPQAEGKAAHVINKAEAYKQEKVARAEGDVAKFKNVLTEYKMGSKDVTRTRLYIEAIEGILPNTEKIILPKNKEGSSVLKLLDLNKLRNTGGQSK
ncbi:protease FtsH subunit HflK [Halanaerobium saccharolyticum]|uniref:Protein HflK n=1 Tax=Halanaerobium saccharolyticum TaxID=43595 RepID=A0A4R7YJ23_9FIRM|nr:FtsH protease activity modulator HflK [Halanaerobium saccharolyticum]RAK03995.1 protease FtsH subunit HflK [Halanaerobium saccharolyticum]TDV97332.1 protease FtsH subunit HflK [Halanaerobium saccharolyticum]TDX49099.1 protease FtsH subunit HflK [Halanaerobium saccharolyticum]